MRAILRGAIPLTAGALLFALVGPGDVSRTGFLAIAPAEGGAWNGTAADPPEGRPLQE